MQLVLMALEALVLALLFVALSQRRARSGLVSMAAAVGVTQHLQVLLASTLYVEVLPGVLASPGSAVLYGSTLFACLLAWREHGLEGTRAVIFGLILANLCVALLGVSSLLHLTLPGATNVLLLPDAVFVSSARVMLVGTGLLFVDMVLVVAAWEALWRLEARGRPGLWLRVVGSLVVVQAFDTTIFVLAALPWGPSSVDLVVDGIIAKSLMCLVYGTVLALAGLRRASPAHRARPVPLTELILGLFFRRRYEELREQALRDPLTGLLNRRGMREGLATVLSRGRGPMSLIMLDLDDFKRINDDHGHAAGDRALRTLGEVVLEEIRAGDLACRYGGDEFVVVLPATDAEAARAVALRLGGRLRDRLGELSEELGARPLTASLGLVTRGTAGLEASAVLEAADRALAEAKREGKDRLVVGEPEEEPSQRPA